MDFLLLCQLSQQLCTDILNSPHFAVLELYRNHTHLVGSKEFFGSIKSEDCNDDDGSGKEGGGEKDVKS